MDAGGWPGLLERIPSTRNGARAIGLALATCSGLACAAASADEQARELLARGVELVRSQDLATGIETLERAAQSAPDAAVGVRVEALCWLGQARLEWGGDRRALLTGP